MKRESLLLMVSMVVMFYGLVNADIIATDSYEGDVDPQDATPPWTMLSNVGTYSVSNGILTISTPDDGSGYRCIDMRDSSSLDFGGSWTVDVRFRLASESTTDFAFTVEVAATHNGWHELNEVFIANDGWSGNSVYHTKVSYPGGITLGTGWHVVRLSRTFIDDGHSHPAKIYLDDMYLGECSDIANVGSPDNRLRVGDDTGIVGGTVDYDYVRWVNGTAYDVDPVSNPMIIPEPVTIGLLVMGIIVSLLRKR